jgi:Galactosyltransferase
VTNLTIAVKSCLRDLQRGDHDVIRSTWGADAKAAKIDVRFFIGSPNDNVSTPRYKTDETVLKCADTYEALPYKTREICRWACGKRVDYLLLVDTDTYVMVKYVLECGFEKFDYLGWTAWEPGKPKRNSTTAPDGTVENYERCYAYASGGIGYFLSRKAFTEVANETPSSWCEDLWCGQVLGPLVATGELTQESTRSNTYTGNVYSIHYPGRWKGNEPYNPSTGWMQQMHAEHR